ncbi:MAG: calcium-binding protein [Microcystis aeruginosa G13-07]|nr:calcium-binding protein [Microcystis aeruginosa G13-07]
MSTTYISAPTGSTTNYTVDASMITSLAAFWGLSSVNTDLAVSIPTAVTGRNLTALGRFTNFSSSFSTWRLLNGSGQSDVASANLTGYKSTPPFSQNYFLPSGSDTFVASAFLGTHILDFGGGQRFTKAENKAPSSDDITMIGNMYSFVLRGADGGDTLTGSGLADTLFGFNGDDSLTGNAGGDSLDGGAGADTLIGGTGGDILNGGDGNDRLTGGTGTNTLDGGNGADTFVFTNQGNQTVSQFITSDNDVFAFTVSAYGGVPTAGTTAVVSAAATATNASSSIIVDTFDSIEALEDTKSLIRFAFATDTKTLLYDLDGDWSTTNATVATITSITGTLVSGNFAFI